MSFWGDFWDNVAHTVDRFGGGVAARAGAAVGAAAGSGEPAVPTGRLKHPAPVYDPAKEIDEALKHPPVAPGEAVKETTQAAVGIGPIAPNLRNIAVWIIIVLVGLIGVWGLLAPGGGVAVIERLKK